MCAVDAAADAKMMQARLYEAASAISKDGQEQADLMQNFHFANVPMSGVSDEGANFLPYLMGHWRSGRHVITTHSAGKCSTGSCKL